MSFLTDALSLLTGANYSDYNTILVKDFSKELRQYYVNKIKK
ncbi:hypothetical protein E34_0131 [Lactococcus lactis subsp. lactis]|nr:hypothetical protein [Lactococcus lactis]KST80321.1 hypothetical protein E34_0131 [Lactococcus lactis subsp. lactis]BDH82947.1 hypothetical protein LLID5_02320 [Lactococcus lactis]